MVNRADKQRAFVIRCTKAHFRSRESSCQFGTAVYHGRMISMLWSAESTYGTHTARFSSQILVLKPPENGGAPNCVVGASSFRDSRAAIFMSAAITGAALKRMARWLRLGIGITLALSAYSQHLPISAFTTVDGLAHDHVLRITRDSQGFLWFCTVDGLSRFDGARFATYGKEHGLPFSSVNDILEIRPAEYWVATNGAGVALLDLRRPSRDGGGSNPSRFTGYRVGDLPTTNRVRIPYRDRSGRIWAGTGGVLFLLEETGSGRRFRPFPDPHTLAAGWASVDLGDARGSRRKPLARHFRWPHPAAAGRSCDPL
jgi:hypothetical protein